MCVCVCVCVCVSTRERVHVRVCLDKMNQKLTFKTETFSYGRTCMYNVADITLLN